MKKYRMVEPLNGRNEIMTTHIAGNCKGIRCEDCPIYPSTLDTTTNAFNGGLSTCLSVALSLGYAEEILDESVAPVNDHSTSNVTHRIITSKLEAIYNSKNADYGNSFDKTFDELGFVSAVTRISDKCERLKSFAVNQSLEVKNESVEDTLLDMANYCIMTVMKIRNDALKK